MLSLEGFYSTSTLLLCSVLMGIEVMSSSILHLMLQEGLFANSLIAVFT